jgi:hypothetical protein
MASTRNKNTAGNYCLEKRQNKDIEQWWQYRNGAGGYAYQTHQAGDGLLQGRVPWDVLSTNAVDTESFLRGIGANNLETPQPAVFTPQPLFYDKVDLFKKETIYMPSPIMLSKQARPFPF